MIEREPQKITEAAQQGIEDDDKWFLVELLLSEEDEKRIKEEQEK